MRNNVRKKMRLLCLLFAMVLLAGVPAAAKDRKNQKAAAENVVKKEMVCKTKRNHLTVEKMNSLANTKENDSYQKRI